MYLHYSAISDVGRVRRENQDSGYAGPWLLTVCDGVGGAVRGDLASSTAVQALRKLDQRARRRHPRPGRRRRAPRRRPDRRARRGGPGPQRHRPPPPPSRSSTAPASASGTSATAAPTSTAAASCASSPTTTPSSSRSSTRAASPRSSRGPTRTATSSSRPSTASATRSPTSSSSPPRSATASSSAATAPAAPSTTRRMADILGTGTPDFAAVELVRASLEAGSTDNVTCIVADVAEEAPPERPPAAARRRRRRPAPPDAARRRRRRALPRPPLRRHRRDPAGARRRARGRLRRRPDRPRGRALRPARAEPLHLAAPAAGRRGRCSAWPGSCSRPAGRGASSSSTSASRTARSTIFRGIDADLPGVSLSHPYEVTDVDARPPQRHRRRAVREGIEADDLDDARLDRGQLRRAPGRRAE